MATRGKNRHKIRRTTEHANQWNRLSGQCSTVWQMVDEAEANYNADDNRSHDGKLSQNTHETIMLEQQEVTSSLHNAKLEIIR